MYKKGVLMFINSDSFTAEGVLYPTPPKIKEEHQHISPLTEEVEKKSDSKEKPLIKEPQATETQKKDSVTLSQEAKEKKTAKKELSEEEQKEIEQLKERDAEVRTHEQAHIAAGGAYILGGASYNYQNGPDGKRYAVGGSVDISTSPIPDDPQATISKMQTVRAAALAPAEPSGQDQQVAASATQNMMTAQQELQEKRQKEGAEETPKTEAKEEISQERELSTIKEEERQLHPYEEQSEALKMVVGETLDVVG